MLDVTQEKKGLFSQWTFLYIHILSDKRRREIDSLFYRNYQ